MLHRTRLIVPLAAALLAGCVAAPVDADEPVTETSALAAGEVGGALVVYGCDPAATEVEVIATPAGGAVVAPGTRPPRVGTAVSVRAAVRRLAAGRFVYNFTGLAARPHSLEVRFTNAACDGARTRTASGGVVIPGVSAANLESLVPRTRTEVLRGPYGAPAGYSAGVVPVAADGSVSSPTMRVLTSLPDVTLLDLQVTADAPSVESVRVSTTPCPTTPGLIHTQPVTVRAGYPVDVRLSLGAVLSNADRTAPRADGRTWRDAFRSGRPVYVRAVPRRAYCDPYVDGGSSWTTFIGADGFRPPAPPPPTLLDFDLNGRNRLGFVPALPPARAQCYSVTRAHKVPADLSFPSIVADPAGAQLVMLGLASAGATVPAGYGYCVWPNGSGGGGGFWGTLSSSFGDFATGLVDGLSWTVNTLASTYERAKVMALDGAQWALTHAGVPCNATCRAGLEFGLNTGLASMGLPPSLPNFDQLTSMGRDYMIQLAAEQAGVPPEALSPLVDAAISRINAERGGSGSARDAAGVAWAVPTDFVRYPYELITARTYSNGNARPSSLRIATSPAVHAVEVRLPFAAPTGAGEIILPPVTLLPDAADLASPPGAGPLFPLSALYSPSYLGAWYAQQWQNTSVAGACFRQVITGHRPSGLAYWSTSPSFPSSYQDVWTTSSPNRCP